MFLIRSTGETTGIGTENQQDRMLREALEYLVTPGDPLARRLGYLHELVALGARYRRHHRAWQPHINSCHAFIDEAVGMLADQGHARRLLVVGSGRLIELPLERLADRFAEVVLLDLVHPWPVRRLIRRFGGRIRLISLDCTGVLARLEQSATPHDLVAATPPMVDHPTLGGRFSLALSCNVLSQLPIAILHQLEQKAVAHNLHEADCNALAQHLLMAHPRWLASLADHACLFTDIEEIWLRNGQPEEQENTLYGLTAVPPDRVWNWDIAPAPEMDRNRDLHHRVGGWFDAGSMFGARKAPGPA